MKSFFILCTNWWHIHATSHIQEINIEDLMLQPLYWMLRSMNLLTEVLTLAFLYMYSSKWIWGTWNTLMNQKLALRLTTKRFLFDSCLTHFRKRWTIVWRGDSRATWVDRFMNQLHKNTSNVFSLKHRPWSRHFLVFINLNKQKPLQKWKATWTYFVNNRQLEAVLTLFIKCQILMLNRFPRAMCAKPKMVC